MADADALVARDYELFKPEILRTVAGKLAAGGVHFDDADLEAFYNEAWHGLYLMLASGEEIDNHKGMLVVIAYRLALNEHRDFRRRSWAGEGELNRVAVETDIDAHLDAKRRLRHFSEGLRARFDRRELQAATLGYLHEYSRPEAAKAIGVTPKRMEKIMDEVSTRARSMIGQVEADRWCEEVDSLMRAYAVGLLDEDGDRYRLASDHLDGCSACRRRVLTMRGLTSITPPAPAATTRPAR